MGCTLRFWSAGPLGRYTTVSFALAVQGAAVMPDVIRPPAGGGGWEPGFRLAPE